VVIDPRASRTAQAADEHHFIRPGTDAHLLFALAHVLFDEGLISPHTEIASITAGIETVQLLAEAFTPEAAATATGSTQERSARIARELAAGATRRGVRPDRDLHAGVSGTLASWLVDVLNLLTGNLDREGGAMFPLGSRRSLERVRTAGRGRGARFGRYESRVRGLSEIFGELPVACLAEEIETPGEGQLKALITVSGNRFVSTPNRGRLGDALEQLEFMLSLDVYINETTRHADVLLPAPSPLRRSHYDLALYLFAVRNRRELLRRPRCRPTRRSPTSG